MSKQKSKFELIREKKDEIKQYLMKQIGEKEYNKVKTAFLDQIDTDEDVRFNQSFNNILVLNQSSKIKKPEAYKEKLDLDREQGE